MVKFQNMSASFLVTAVTFNKRIFSNFNFSQQFGVLH